MTAGEAARRGVAFALGGAAAVVLGEVAGAVMARGDAGAGAILRFAAIAVALVGLAAVATLPLAALGGLGARSLGRAIGGDGHDPRRALPWLWAIGVALVLFVLASYGLTRHFLERKEPYLIALLLAVLQLALLAALGVAVPLLAALLRRAAGPLERALGRWSPLGAGRPALAAAFVAGAVPLAAALLRSRALLARQGAAVAAVALFLVGGALAAVWAAARGPRPSGGRGRRWLVAGGVAAAWLGLSAVALLRLGDDAHAARLATRPRTVVGELGRLARRATDFDRDGVGLVLGHHDCAPRDRRRHPDALEVPDNGVDENCNGRDLSSQAIRNLPPGAPAPVPEEFRGERRRWNVLLVTVDALRWDRTTLGGHLEAKGRDTTPRLAAFARRATSFRFCNAPAPGPATSLAAIMTSRWPWEQLALAPERRPAAPGRLLDENTTLAEVLAGAGLRAAAFVSGDGLQGAGLEQGFETFEVEATGGAEGVTRRALAWIGAQGDAPWFAWVHVAEPRLWREPRPGAPTFGTAPADRYDATLVAVDEQLGRLLDGVTRGRHGRRTIVVVAGTHGTAFGEHGVTGHEASLHRELLHVPCVVAVPGAEAFQASGAVSAMDLFPTIAALVGADVSALGLEGVSLVRHLFYGAHATDRFVFAETSTPEPQRAAISGRYKLIFKVRSNAWELYDVSKDAVEKTNVAGRDQNGLTQMKTVLDAWLDRVYFARSATSAVHQQRRQWLLETPPSPARALDAVVGDTVRVLGWDPPGVPVRPGDALQVVVYLRAEKPVLEPYQLELDVSQVGPPAVSNRASKTPGDGSFALTRLRPGEIWRDTLTVRVPPAWKPGRTRVALRLLDGARAPAPAAGPSVGPDGAIALGTLALEAAPAPPTPLKPIVPNAPAPRPLVPTRPAPTPAPRPLVPTRPAPTPAPAPAPRAP